MGDFIIELCPPRPGRDMDILQRHVLPLLQGPQAHPLRPGFAYVTPTRRKADAVRRSLMRLTGHSLFDAPVTTLTAFFERLLHAGGRRAVLLPDIARLAVIERSLKSRRNKLTFLTRTTAYPGMVHKLAALFAEFKQNGIFTAGELEKRFARREIPADKARDLVLLFEDYIDRLANGAGDAPLCDAEDALRLVRADLRDGGLPALMPHVQLLILDGFYDFNPLQRSVLKRLLATAPNVLAAMDMEDPARTPAARYRSLFRLAQRNLGFYKSCGRSFTVQRLRVEEQATPAEEIAARLFQSGVAQSGDKISPGEQVLLLHPPDAVTGVVEIARRIKQLSARGGALSRMAVVFPALENYVPLIRDLFSRHGIPYEISAGRPLASSPVTAAVLDMLEAASGNYSRPVVVRFLGSPFIDARPHGDARAPDAHVMDVLAREARISGGRGPGDWLAALKRNAAARRDMLEKLDPDDRECMVQQRALRDMDDAAALLRHVFDMLDPLRADAEVSPGEFTDMIERLIRGFGMRRLVGQGADRDVSLAGARRNAGALEAVEQVLSELRIGLELTAAGDTYPVRELMDMLRTALLNAQYFPAPRARGGVQVMGLLETRGLDFDTIFLGGLTDEHIPKKDVLDFCLSARERNIAGIESIRADISEDRYLFYRLFRVAEKQLILSCPLKEGERDVVPSMFLDELNKHMDAADVELKCGDHSRLYSEADALTRFGELAQRAPEDVGQQDFAFAAALPHERLLHAAHCIDVEHKRAAAHEPTIFHGRINGPWHLNVLRGMFAPPRHTIGVTVLEQYARCPFRFFISHILGAAPLAEVEEELTSPERGILVHGILEAFYRGRFVPGEDRIEHVTRDNLAHAEQQILRLARSRLGEFEYEGVFWDSFRDSLLSGLQGYETSSPNRANGLLKNFLLAEADDPDWCKPRFVESSFSPGYEDGPDARGTSLRGPALRVNLNGADIFIKGKIDRIDVSQGDKKRFMVIDYKSYRGKPRSSGDLVKGIKQGRDYQLPLYLLMAQGALGAEYEPIGAALYSVHNVGVLSGKSAHFVNADYRDKTGTGQNAVRIIGKKGYLDSERFYEFLNVQLMENVEEVLRAMTGGMFHFDITGSNREQCRFCEANRICRLDKRVVEHMRKRAEAGDAKAFLPSAGDA